MYARVTTFQIKPDRLDDMVAAVDAVRGQIARVAGIQSVHGAWRADGSGVTVAIYDSQASAEAAAATIQSIWGGLAEFLAAPPNAEAYDQVEKLAG